MYVKVHYFQKCKQKKKEKHNTGTSRTNALLLGKLGLAGKLQLALGLGGIALGGLAGQALEPFELQAARLGLAPLLLPPPLLLNALGLRQLCPQTPRELAGMSVIALKEHMTDKTNEQTKSTHCFKRTRARGSGG